MYDLFVRIRLIIRCGLEIGYDVTIMPSSREIVGSPASSRSLRRGRGIALWGKGTDPFDCRCTGRPSGGRFQMRISIGSMICRDCQPGIRAQHAGHPRLQLRIGGGQGRGGEAPRFGRRVRPATILDVARGREDHGPEAQLASPTPPIERTSRYTRIPTPHRHDEFRGRACEEMEKPVKAAGELQERLQEGKQ